MLLWKLLCFLVPTLIAHFFWVPVSESVDRKIKDEPFPDNLETLEWRLLSYLDDNQFPEPSEDYQTIDDVSTEIINGVQQLINE